MRALLDMASPVLRSFGHLKGKAEGIIQDEAITPPLVEVQIEEGRLLPVPDHFKGGIRPYHRNWLIDGWVKNKDTIRRTATFVATGGVGATAVDFALSTFQFSPGLSMLLTGTSFMAIGAAASFRGVLSFRDRLALRYHLPDYFADPALIDKIPDRKQQAQETRQKAFNAAKHFNLIEPLVDDLFYFFTEANDLKTLRAIGDSLVFLSDFCTAKIGSYIDDLKKIPDQDVRRTILLKSLLLIDSDTARKAIASLDPEDDSGEDIRMDLATFVDVELNARQASWVLNFGGQLKGAILKVDNASDISNLTQRGRDAHAKQMQEIRAGIARFHQGAEFEDLQERYDLNQIKSDLKNPSQSKRTSALETLQSHFRPYIDRIQIVEDLALFIEHQSKPGVLSRQSNDQVREFNIISAIELLSESDSPEALQFLMTLLFDFKVPSLNPNDIGDKPEPHRIELSTAAYEKVFEALTQKRNPALLPLLLYLIRGNRFVNEEVRIKAAQHLTVYSPKRLLLHKGAIEEIRTNNRKNTFLIRALDEVLETIQPR